MEGIKFGNKHTYLDYGLILTHKEIGAPTHDTQAVKIPGANGLLKLNKYIGPDTYSNRSLKFEFEVVKKQVDIYELYNQILNDIHGKELKIVLDIDEDFYFIGEVNINPWASDKKIGKIVIDVDAEPFRYRRNPTVKSEVIGATGEKLVNLINLKMQTTPTIKTTAETLLKFNNTTIVMNAGTAPIYELQLEEGDNPVTILAEPGTVVTFEYQEGEL